MTALEIYLHKCYYCVSFFESGVSFVPSFIATPRQIMPSKATNRPGLHISAVAFIDQLFTSFSKTAIKLSINPVCVVFLSEFDDSLCLNVRRLVVVGTVERHWSPYLHCRVDAGPCSAYDRQARSTPRLYVSGIFCKRTFPQRKIFPTHKREEISTTISYVKICLVYFLSIIIMFNVWNERGE